jgi:hypothetical protein|tara:strand:+ start:6657 stop:7445 length:789 start_codon:yes stop_codon:yes gene_type:complete
MANKALSTTGLAATEKDREDLLASMEEKTRSLAIQGGNKLKKLQAVGTLLYYDLGTLINDILSDETMDGKGEVTKLASYWGIDNVNKLCEWRNTALTFDRDYVLEQAELPLPNGKDLTFEHFKALRRIEDDTQRESLLARTREESWSAQELATEIRGSVQTSVVRKGGRNPSVPSTLTSVVQKSYTSSQQLLRYLDALDDDVLSRFEELPANEATDKFLENIDNTLVVLDSTAAAVADFREALGAGRARVASIMTNTAEAES